MAFFATATSVFGDAGTNGQHAFFQLLHQGADVVPLDILAVREGSEGDPAARRDVAVAEAHRHIVGTGVGAGAAVGAGRRLCRHCREARVRRTAMTATTHDRAGR